jgi:F-type H+-transporting ATPase subunit a
MLLALLQEHGSEHAAEHAHEPPSTIFTPLWRIVRETPLGQWYEFDKTENELGRFWFDAIGFSLIAAILLVLFAWLATRRYERVPRGLQNVFEWIVGLLRGMVHGFIPGKQGDLYVPYLGSLFLFIFAMNMLGTIPGFRAPTMTLSTTAALGITTFVMVQQYAIRSVGLVKYIKHFMGDVLWLAPLMLVVEIIGELAKPLSLSLRLYGNIFGEDNVIEQLMTLGGYIPLQLPMLLLALFTSLLQAFIFTTLSTIYIASKVVHEGGDHDGEHQASQSFEPGEHAQGAHHG